MDFSNIYTGDRPSQLVSTQIRTSYPDGIGMFIELNKCFPSNITFDNIKIPDFKNNITEKFSITPENFIEGRYPLYEKDKPKEDAKWIINRMAILIDQDLIIIGYGGKEDVYDFNIFYSTTTNKDKLEEIKTWFNQNYTENKNSEIGIIGNGINGLFIRFFKINVPNININEYYNDDFIEVHEKILEKLKNNNYNKGVILFHGRPGTGKTSYIRYISSLVEKRMIFVPQELAYQIANPNFLSLLMDYPNSILILEDAENVIKDRMGNDNSPVASILNISDGLLSDCLNLQMICTFNTDIGKIDKALLRKGRIISKYEFKELNYNKANKLAEKNGFNVKFKKDVPLSDVFNPDEDEYLSQNKSIGFYIEKPVYTDECPEVTAG